MIEKILFEQQLANGVSLRCIDASRHYYGGFHHVSIEVECAVMIIPEHCASAEEYDAASAALGKTASFSKVLSKMAVPSSRVDETKQELLATFINHTMNYIDSRDFPANLIRTNLAKTRKTGRGSCGARSTY